VKRVHDRAKGRCDLQHAGEGGGRTHAETSFATVGAILVLQRADDLIVDIGDGEGALESSRRHARDSSRHPSSYKGIGRSGQPQGQAARSWPWSTRASSDSCR
jgi:hypothetical protein